MRTFGVLVCTILDVLIQFERCPVGDVLPLRIHLYTVQSLAVQYTGSSTTQVAYPVFSQRRGPGAPPLPSQFPLMWSLDCIKLFHAAISLSSFPVSFGGTLLSDCSLPTPGLPNNKQYLCCLHVPQSSSLQSMEQLYHVLATHTRRQQHWSPSMDAVWHC